MGWVWDGIEDGSIGMILYEVVDGFIKGLESGGDVIGEWGI